MRPFELNPFFMDINVLSGVGPKVAPLMKKAINGSFVKDAMFHFPMRVIDRRFNSKISDAPIGKSANFEIIVEKHEKAVSNRPYRVLVSDETGFMTLVFFHPNPKYLTSVLPIGEKRIISGEVFEKYGEKQMLHPARILSPDSDELDIIFEPVYSNVAGLSQKTLGKACFEAASKAELLKEWLDASVKEKYGFIDFLEAIKNIHHPKTEDDVYLLGGAKKRLAFDELFARQLALLINNEDKETKEAIALNAKGEKGGALIKAFGFTPTGAQLRAFSDIKTDIAKHEPMVRLLQGDVGAGKTLVAAYACALAFEAGSQSAIMAPTEILASQHYEAIGTLFEKIGIKSALLTGKIKGKARAQILEALAAGELDVVFGTHALFQDKVNFKNLCLVVIDEQHRFGVNDRRLLLQKGKMPHLLSMSATPIPRTLSMAIYGDIETSILNEKPKGRIEIKTSAMPLEKIPEIEAAVKRAIAKDDRVYWVCPLVEESEKIDLTDASSRFERLKSLFGDKVELIHGKMKPSEKDAAMERFRSGSAKVLVATTVIEVGVDVKEASIIIIEHAERFGLAQLHQLRGRVGRGVKESHCLLLYQHPLGKIAKERINILKESTDGFKIAEKDFELRGGGDLLGLKQTGLPDFKIADIAIHKELLPLAKDYAKYLLNKDPKLESEKGKAARSLMYLFDIYPSNKAD